ncbi:MAG: outer membrane lipoprotein-sorting protein [candidate division Zixibacteria bacterium]|nr:outer membrane lipoprotein-sorting protein [candidate division Zixibacteria bacterium]
MSMKIARPDWSRELGMKSWSKGRELSLIIITEPARDKGTAFLKRGNEVWNWVPRVEKVIKIPPSMMQQSWMGSDFTNDDLVKESSIVEDYSHEIVGDSVIQGRECYKIKMTPKPEAPVVWDKVLLWVSKKHYLQMRGEYYNEDGELENTMIMTDVKTLGGRLIPAIMTMIPADEPGNKTVITIHEMQFNQPINDSFFSERNMKKMSSRI